jgi:DnaA family protein
MPKPRQYTLAIEQPLEQRLDNFVAGQNAELLAILGQASPKFQGVWLYGPLGSGRSHLLKGCCLRAQEQGYPVVYIGCADYADDAPGLMAALQLAGRTGDVVALDDIGALAGDFELEALVLGVYQRVLSERGVLLITHTHASLGLSFATPDLASRMRSLQHFQIRQLGDNDKIRVLRQRALNRGYELAPAVLDYWLARGPRDLGALLADLDLLDQASLAQQQKVTIPLLKEVLGY